MMYARPLADAIATGTHLLLLPVLLPDGTNTAANDPNVSFIQMKEEETSVSHLFSAGMSFYIFAHPFNYARGELMQNAPEMPFAEQGNHSLRPWFRVTVCFPDVASDPIPPEHVFSIWDPINLSLLFPPSLIPFN